MEQEKVTNQSDEQQHQHLREKACLMQKPSLQSAELLSKTRSIFPSLLQKLDDDDKVIMMSRKRENSG